ncbi:hypothetical protein Tco_1226220 [Tanacetum coccineum]
MVPSINKIQSKASDVESDQTTRLAYRKQVADPIPEQQRMFEFPIPIMDSGKLYDSYMKKRDARLRESWDSNGAEKEARMKAMNDSLERHSTEMKATFSSWFEDRHNSVSCAQRRAENPRSFNARSALKREEPQDFEQLQDDGDLSSLGLLRNIQGRQVMTVSIFKKKLGDFIRELRRTWCWKCCCKMKASIVSEVVNKDEEYDKPIFEPDVKDGGLEELDTTETESFSQVDHTSVAELPATVTSPFPVQDSPGESPVSWNSHTNFPFSYNHEASDFESPMRSPASWNLQPTEADAARMRKK